MNFDVLEVVVILNVVATIALWRTAARRPQKLKKQFREALLHSEPITPKHQPPTMIGGEKLPSVLRKANLTFFDDFSEFGRTVNWWLEDGPFRLQEKPDTELTLNLSDSPSFGRRYDVFHNQVCVGTLEISPLHYPRETPNVRAEIHLEGVRLLPIGIVRDFLHGVAFHVCDPEEKQTFIQDKAIIERSLTDALWQAQQTSEFDQEEPIHSQLELQLNGSANWYFERRQAMLEQQSPA